ncbi:two component transcriptional regulator [Caballeronia arationis]|uniref:response regulator transcription factor n=1 Tax=Caballeronia arationis TaxID=1777142 RepID=UPI00074BB889|nr:response regulator [Caballeronia arationis]SAL06888.1 two component transcriptional regulator [Caballeronia arationis]
MRVLFVENDTRLCETFRDLARSLGHLAAVAYDGHQAMLLTRENRYDTIFLDIGLPDADGRGVCKRLRAAGPSKLACVVAVTGDERHVQEPSEHLMQHFSSRLRRMDSRLRSLRAEQFGDSVSQSSPSTSVLTSTQCKSKSFRNLRLAETSETAKWQEPINEEKNFHDGRRTLGRTNLQDCRAKHSRKKYG